MDYIEKHVTTKYGVDRIDWTAAISIDMMNSLIEKLKILELINGNGQIELNEGEKVYSIFGPMKKAALMNRDIKSGEVFDLSMVDFKRTSQISDLSQIEVIQSVGKIIKNNLNINDVLLKKYLEKEKTGKLK